MICSEWEWRRSYCCKHHQGIIDTEPSLGHCVANVDTNDQEDEHDECRRTGYANEKRHASLRVDIVTGAKSENWVMMGRVKVESYGAGPMLDQ